MQNSDLLTVRDLRTYFFTRSGTVQAVDGVDLTIRAGQVLGVVGESGCGKSVTALSLLRLVAPPGKNVSGSALFKGKDLLKLRESEMVRIRGKQISMIFQQPQAALDPVYRVGDQIVEAIRIHNRTDQRKAWKRAVELLEMVGIPDAASRANSFPYEFSGGMAQRVMIAVALACNPELLIADEPTTALDVTVQAQILDLLRSLREKTGMAMMLITHDLGVIAEMADRVAVMYAGQVVEETTVRKLFSEPAHPYTQGLIACMPTLDRDQFRLEVIPGTVPNLIDPVAGCRFAPRCGEMVRSGLSICTQELPPLRTLEKDHMVRCWLYDETRLSVNSRSQMQSVSCTEGSLQ